MKRKSKPLPIYPKIKHIKTSFFQRSRATKKYKAEIIKTVCNLAPINWVKKEEML